MADVCNTNKVQELNELVKSCITQAFLQLLETKDFHKISITEITEKAGVARVSFYRNFDSKEDVLTKHIEKIFFGMEFSTEWFSSYGSMLNFSLNYFQSAYDNRGFFSLLHKNNLLYLIHEIFIKYSIKHITDTGNYMHEIQSPFFAGAAYGVINYWIKNDFNPDVEKMAENFSKFFF